MPKFFIQLPKNSSKKIRNSICGYHDTLQKELSTSDIFQVDLPIEELEDFKSQLPLGVEIVQEVIYSPNDKLKMKDGSDYTCKFLSYDFTEEKDKIILNCIVEKAGEKKVIEFEKLVRN